MSQLKAKEGQVSHTPTEYLSRGKEKIQTLQRRHRGEGKKVMKDFKEQKAGFVATCFGARDKIQGLSTEHLAIDVGVFRKAAEGNGTAERLQSLHPEI